MLRIVVGEDGYSLAKSGQASWWKLTTNTKFSNKHRNQEMNVSICVEASNANQKDELVDGWCLKIHIFTDSWDRR